MRYPLNFKKRLRHVSGLISGVLIDMSAYGHEPEKALLRAAGDMVDRVGGSLPNYSGDDAQQIGDGEVAQLLGDLWTLFRRFKDAGDDMMPPVFEGVASRLDRTMERHFPDETRKRFDEWSARKRQP